MASVIASPRDGTSSSGKKHRIRKYANKRKSGLDDSLQNSNNGNDSVSDTLDDGDASFSEVSVQSKRSSVVTENLLDSINNDSEEFISFNRESYSGNKKSSKQSRRKRNLDSPNRRLTANMEDLHVIMKELQDDEEENKRPKSNIQESPEISPQPKKYVRNQSPKVSSSSDINLRRSPRHITTPVIKNVRRQTADGDEIKRLIEDLQNDNSKSGICLEDSIQEESLSINISLGNESVSSKNRSSIKETSVIGPFSPANGHENEDSTSVYEDVSSFQSADLTPSHSQRKGKGKGKATRNRNRRETADSFAIAQLMTEIQAEDSNHLDTSTLESNDLSQSKEAQEMSKQVDDLFHESKEPEYTNSNDAITMDRSDININEQSSIAASEDSPYSLSKHNNQGRRDTADPADIAQLILELGGSQKDDDPQERSSPAILNSSHNSNNTVDTFMLVQSVEDVLQQETADQSPLLSDVLGSNKVAESPLLSDSAMTDSIGDVWQTDRQELDLSEVRTSPATVYMHESMLLDSSRDESGNSSLATIGTVNLLQSVEAALEEEHSDISTCSHSMRSLAGLLTTNLEDSGIDDVNASKVQVEPAKKRRLSNRRKSSTPKAQLGITRANATEVTVSPRKLTTSAATLNPPLKSCLSSRKQLKGLEKSVVFGSPAFAEFNHLSPPTRITPLTKRQALISSKKRRQQEAETQEVVLDAVTEENNRILEEWDRLALDTSNSPEESDVSRYSTPDESRTSSGGKGRSKSKKRRLSRIHPDLSRDQGQEEEIEELPSTLEDLLVRETQHDAEEGEGIDDVSRTQEVEVDLGHLLRRLSQDNLQIQYNSGEECDDKEDDSRLGLLLGRDRAEWDGEQQSSYDDEINNSTIQDLIYQDGKRLDLSSSQPVFDLTDDRASNLASRSPLELSVVASPQLGLNAARLSQLELSVSGNISVQLPLYLGEDDDKTAKLEDNLLAVLTATDNEWNDNLESMPQQQQQQQENEDEGEEEELSRADQNASNPESLLLTSSASYETADVSQSGVLPDVSAVDIDKSDRMEIVEDDIVDERIEPQPVEDVCSPDLGGEKIFCTVNISREEVLVEEEAKQQEYSAAAVPSQSSSLLLQRLRALAEVKPGSDSEQCSKRSSVGIADVDNELPPFDYSRPSLNTNWDLNENSSRSASNKVESTISPDNEIDVSSNEKVWSALLSFVNLLQKFRRAAEEQTTEKLGLLVRSALKDAAVRSSSSISLPGNTSLCSEVAADFDRLWMAVGIAADDHGQCRSAETVIREYLREKRTLVDQLLQDDAGVQIEMEQFEARWLTESALAVNKAKLLLAEQHQSDKDRPASSSSAIVLMQSSPLPTHAAKPEAFQVGDKFYNKVLHNTPIHTGGGDGCMAVRIEPSRTWNALHTAEKEAADLQVMVNIVNSLTYCEVTTLQSSCISVNAYLTPRVIATIRFNIEQTEQSSQSQSQGMPVYGLSDMEVDISLGRVYSSIGEERRLQVLEDDFARGFFVSVLCFCAEEEDGLGCGPLSRRALMDATLPCHIPGILRKVNGSILSLRYALAELKRIHITEGKGRSGRHSIRRGKDPSDCSMLLRWSDSEGIDIPIRRFVSSLI
eukprot:gene26999-35704_t